MYNSQGVDARGHNHKGNMNVGYPIAAKQTGVVESSSLGCRCCSI